MDHAVGEAGVELPAFPHIAQSRCAHVPLSRLPRSCAMIYVRLGRIMMLSPPSMAMLCPVM
jgi:hypothetical protein